MNSNIVDRDHEQVNHQGTYHTKTINTRLRGRLAKSTRREGRQHKQEIVIDIIMKGDHNTNQARAIIIVKRRSRSRRPTQQHKDQGKQETST
jgi:hypothetical protein